MAGPCEELRYIGTSSKIAIFSSACPIRDRIYLDHAATSPLRPEAKAAMEEGYRLWANPSSPHAEGRKARAMLEDARERIKTTLEWDGELIFTSGASEALAIGLQGSQPRKQVASAVEHDAVFRAAPDAHLVAVGQDGRVEHDGLREALVDGPAVCAIQHVNSETGTMQDFGPLRALLASSDSLLLADCSQSAQGYSLPDADMIVVSAHKFGGPIGVGALLVRDLAMLQPSGGHERGYRQGTENLPGILGMAAALEAARQPAGWTSPAVNEAFDSLRQTLCARGATLIAPGVRGSHAIAAVAHPDIGAQAMLIRLDAMGFAVSAGSACSSGTLRKSRALDAFGIDDLTASRAIRLSIGWTTTTDDLERFAEAWAGIT